MLQSEVNRLQLNSVRKHRFWDNQKVIALLRICVTSIGTSQLTHPIRGDSSLIFYIKGRRVSWNFIVINQGNEDFSIHPGVAEKNVEEVDFDVEPLLQRRGLDLISQIG